MLTLNSSKGFAGSSNQDDSNDIPQPIYEGQVDFPILWIEAYPGLS